MTKINVRRALALITLLLSSLSAASAQTHATVAAWNLGGFDPIPNSRVDNLARAINRLRPDIIALTEVNPAERVLQRIADSLDEEYEFVYFEENTQQNIALLYKVGVQVSDERLINRSDDNNSSLRKALAARVKIRNFDFIIIAVHMKSSRGEPHHSTRNSQARAIASFIRAQTAGAEKDVLLVGDYNMIPGEDDANFDNISPDVGGEEFLRFVSSEPPILNLRTHVTRCSSDGATATGGNHLDGYAISREHTGEFVAGSLRALPFNSSVFRRANGQNRNCRSYTGELSDHLLLVGRFLITDDDD